MEVANRRTFRTSESEVPFVSEDSLGEPSCLTRVSLWVNMRYHNSTVITCNFVQIKGVMDTATGVGFTVCMPLASL